MPPHLALLHTTPVIRDTFARLLAKISPDLPVEHIVAEEFLADARERGVTQELDDRIRHRIRSAAEDGAAVVLCTCSTIGGSAERATCAVDSPVIRIDRPMAEAAVRTGPRIIVAAALESTMAPTRDLILEVAQEMDKDVELTEVLCGTAWERFEDGDQEGYWREIARTITGRATEGDVIVLAQASMAGAADLCTDLAIPVLSSPEIGLRHAIDIWNANRR